MRPQSEINAEIERMRPEREAIIRRIERTFAVCEDVAKREMEGNMTNPSIQAAIAIREAAIAALRGLRISGGDCEGAGSVDLETGFADCALGNGCLCAHFNHAIEEALAVLRAIPLPEPAPDPREQCQRCQGNGEIVTDWDRYKNPRDGDIGDEAVADCPDCDGTGECVADPREVSEAFMKICETLQIQAGPLAYMDARDLRGTIARLSGELAAAREALESVNDWLHDERLSRWLYMESGGFDQDRQRHSDKVRAVLAKLSEKEPNPGSAETSERAVRELRSQVAAAREALAIGEAWTEEYLNECKHQDIPAEVERVEHGLTKIRAALAKLRAALAKLSEGTGSG